jgi:D-alanine-D-alanine ligase
MCELGYTLKSNKMGSGSMSKKKIVLIQGGMGAEREVSLSTGAGFKQALVELGYPFEIIDAKEDLPLQLYNSKADVALLALHGKYAEDGIVQGICEYLKLPYTGCGVLASALCMDKVLTKQILSYQGIPTAKEQFVNAKKTSIKNVKLSLPLPVVVKPSREGSSVGVSIVKTEKDFLPALQEAAKYDYEILIEEYIPGLEITVPVLAGKALSPIEIEPKVDFYTYKNKYTAGNTEYFIPARISEKAIAKIKEIALKTCEVCRVRTYARVDFRMTKDEKPYVMEINTLPGCTPTSLFPKSAKHEGISFNQLIETLIENAGLDYEGLS